MVRLVASAVLLIGVAVQAAGPKVDAQGDALPAGAVARYGSVRFRGPFAAGPDDRTLGTLRDNHVCLIDATSGAAVKQLPGPAPEMFEVESFTVSPDYRFAAYFNARGTQLWDLAAGVAVASLTKEPDEQPLMPWVAARWAWAMEGQQRAVFVPHTSLVVFRHADRLVGWDLALGREVWKIDAQQCKPVGVRPDDNSVVAFSGDFRKSVVMLIDAPTGRSNKVELDEQHYYAQVAVSPDGRQLAVVDYQGKIHRYELPGGKKLPAFKMGWSLFGRLNETSYGRNGLAYSADGMRLFVADNGTLQVFNVVKGDRASSVGIVNSPGALGEVHRDLVLSSDGSTVWVRNNDFSPWRKFAGSPPKAVAIAGAGEYGPVKSLTVAGGDPVARAVEQGKLRQWSIDTGRSIGEFTPAGRASSAFTGYAPATTSALSVDGKRLATLEFRGATVWDTAAKKRIASVSVSSFGEVSAVALSSDGKVLAVGPASDWNGLAGQTSPGRAIRLFEADTGKEIRSLGEHHEQTSAMAFSVDRRRLAVLTMTHTWQWRGYLLDAESGRQLRTVEGATAVAFAPFADALALATPGEITLVELCSGDVRWRVKAPATSITKLAISPDGRWLAAAESPGGSRRIHLWDLRTGAALPPFFGHAAAITGLAFAGGGRLVSTSEDATALTWDMGSRPGSPVPPAATADEFAKAFAELAADAATAHRAIERLLAAGPPTATRLRKHLRPATPPDPARVRLLLEALGASSFADRDHATAALEALDFQVRPLVAAFAATAQSPEARVRAARISDRLHRGAISGDRLRELRAVEILSRLATPDAVQLLKELASGDPEARLTIAAKLAVKDESKN